MATNLVRAARTPLSSRWAVPLVVLGVTLFLASVAHAQTPVTGSLSAYVVDQEGQPLPGVTVTVTDTRRGLTYTRVSNSEGYFVMPALEPSVYDVRLTLSGFQEMISEGIEVGPNARVRLEYEMTPSVEVAETVTVVAQTPAIERTEPAIKKTISYQQFDELPIRSRDFRDVVDTLPGVTQNGPNFNINGSRSSQNIFLIDGARNNDLTGTAQRFSRGLYFIIAFQNPQDPTVGLDIGFNLQNFNQDAISEIQVVSSAYSAEFGQGSGGIINLITRSGTDNWNAGFTFNYQDESLNAENTFKDLSRTQESIFLGGPIVSGKTWFFGSYERDDNRVGFDERRIAEPGEPAGGLIRPFANDLDIPQSDTDLNRFTTKVTSQLSENNVLNATLNYISGTSDFNAAINRPTPEEVEPRHGENKSWSVLLNDFHTFESGNYLYSLLKFSDLDRRSFSDFGTTGTQPIIWSVGPDGGLVFTDFYVTGAFGEVIDANIKSVEWKEAFTAFFDKHSLKIGFDYQRFAEDLFIPARDLIVSDNIAPDGTVIPVDTIPAPDEALFPFFISGIPEDADLDLTLNQYSAFVQDDWSVSPRWTVSMGLRYDRDDFLKNNEFSPRIHTIYSLNEEGTLVLRAGAGVFRDRSTLLSLEEQGEIQSRFIILDKATGEPIFNSVPDKNVFFTEDFNSPITYEANVGLEYDVGDGYVVGANFIYKEFEDLIWTKIINERSIEGDPLPNPNIPANSRLIGNFGTLRDNIVEVTFRKSFGNGSFFNVNYTFEDTLGNTSQELAGRNETVVNSIQEAPDQEELRHPADFEVQHALKISGVARLPLGIDFSSILKWRSGRPWTAEERVATPFAHFIAPEGINSRNLPAEFQWDARFSKQIEFGRHVIEAYVDAFNLTNHENIRSVQPIITFANFGEPTSFGLPRTLQLGFKYRF